MKKIFIAIISLLISSKVFSQVKLDNLKMKKLGKDEYLDFTYLKESGEYNLTIFKVDKNGNKIEDLFFINHQYGNIQISNDRKLLFISGLRYKESADTQVGKYNYYLIDGNNGRIKFLFTTNKIIRTSNKLDYYIVVDSYKKQNGFKIEVRDLNNNKIVRDFYWNIERKNGGWCELLRSPNPDYDFMLSYVVDNFVLAECLYRIKDNKLDLIFEDYSFSKEYIVSLYLNGFVPNTTSSVSN